jgi:DNA repair protein RadC
VAEEKEVIRMVIAAYRLEIIRTKLREPGTALNSTAETARRYGYLERYERERLIRLDLDSKNRILSEEVVSIGTVDSAPVSPREVFKGAVLSSASRVILVHNHPSGCPEPSSEDEETYSKLQHAGELLGIPVIDFLIIGEDGRYWSLDSGPGTIKPVKRGRRRNAVGD